VQAATDPEFPIKWSGSPRPRGPVNLNLIVHPIRLEEMQLVIVEDL